MASQPYPEDIRLNIYKLDIGDSNPVFCDLSWCRNVFHSILQKFQVQYTVSDFSDDDSVETVSVKNGNDFALLTALDPNKAYKMKAIGYTPNGDSIQSDVVHFKLIPKSKIQVPVFL